MPGTEIFTDSHQGYSDLMVSFEHISVNHDVCFMGPNGENTNQAESFFSRFRRPYQWTGLTRLAPNIWNCTPMKWLTGKIPGDGITSGSPSICLVDCCQKKRMGVNLDSEGIGVTPSVVVGDLAWSWLRKFLRSTTTRQSHFLLP